MLHTAEHEWKRTARAREAVDFPEMRWAIPALEDEDCTIDELPGTAAASLDQWYVLGQLLRERVRDIQGAVGVIHGRDERQVWRGAGAHSVAARGGEASGGGGGKVSTPYGGEAGGPGPHGGGHAHGVGGVATKSFERPRCSRLEVSGLCAR